MDEPHRRVDSKKLLGSLFDSHGNGHGHTDHGVVTCADKCATDKSKFEIT